MWSVSEIKLNYYYIADFRIPFYFLYYDKKFKVYNKRVRIQFL
mgnify:CR=1 FL=1